MSTRDHNVGIADAWSAARITGIYAVFAAVWIFLSDRLLEWLLPSARLEEFSWFQTIKGLLFVAVTTALLWLLVVRRLRQVRSAVRDARATENQLRQFADNMPGIVSIKDADLRITFIRGQSPEGMSFEVLVGKRVTEFMDPATAARVEANDRQVIETGTPTQYVEPIPMNGRNGHYLIHRFPMSGPGGEQWLGAVTLDVTERQEAEARIRTLARELEEANRLKDQFLSNLSHELRTPITAIRLWTDVLKGAAPGDAETVRESADMILHSALAQSRLIEDLLDVTRIIAGKLKVEPKPISFGEVVAATVGLLAPMAEERRVVVTTTLPPGPHPIMGDARRVEQIVWNLLTNALKFSKARGTVRVELARAADEWVLSVADEGMGISADLIPHLFTRFRQADSSITRAEGGLGIGLSLVKFFVEAHGGSVGVASAGEGKGATFTVRLPVSAAEVPAPVAAPAAGPGAQPPAPVSAASPKGPLDGIRVLLVEDNADSRTGLSLWLRRAGATVRGVETADAAVAALNEGEFDVLLSDIGLPERDGCDLVKEVRQLPGWQSRPAIAISAYALPEDTNRAINSGFDAFVVKPVDPDKLMELLAGNLQKAG